MSKWFILLAALVHSFARAETLAELLKPYGVSAKATANFKITKSQRVVTGQREQDVLEFSSPEGVFYKLKVIKKIEAALAKTIADQERAAIKALYSAQQTPYMADIAQAVGGCPARFGPFGGKLKIWNQEVDVVLGAASSAFEFGACVPDAATHRGAFFTVYDSQTQRLWVWRVFSPWQDQKKGLRGNWLPETVRLMQK